MGSGCAIFREENYISPIPSILLDSKVYYGNIRAIIWTVKHELNWKYRNEWYN